jgi:hypothetical protein
MLYRIILSWFHFKCVPSGGLTLVVGTQQWGISCKVQRRPPADIILNESLLPKIPRGHHVHGLHGHASPVKNRWRFSKFRKRIWKFDRHFKNLYLARKWVQRALVGIVWKLGLRATHSVLNTFGQTIYWSTSKPWTSPEKRSNDLERSKFRQQVQSFVYVPPWRRITFEFWEMLKNSSEVTLVPTIYFF